ncbi:MAG: prolipoprotein diacylglyceryl transferase [Clostridia bacterium]|nr:prolipoprotein diacylglyceryl transferase [Clostridia bacterium]
MNDFTTVYFNFSEKGFEIPSVLASFNLPLIGEVTIKWYGAIIAFGFMLAVLFGGRMAYKWRMSIDKMLDVLIYGTVFGVLGARIYYVLFEWGYYKDHLSDVFKIWEGGLAIYGGIIGGILAAYITCRIDKLNFRNLLDLIGMSLLIGQGIGRWGNFMNQEAFGTNTDLPWGMWSEKIADYISQNQPTFAEKGITMDPMKSVHPTFLYESVWCLLGFAVLYIICKKFRKFSGQLFLSYGVWYGTERAIVEGFRTDSLYLFNTGIRVSQLLSATVAVACLVALIILLRKYSLDPQPIEGVDFFVEDEKRKKGKNEADGEDDDGTDIIDGKKVILKVKSKEEDGTEMIDGKKVILKIKSKVEDDGEHN